MDLRLGAIEQTNTRKKEGERERETEKHHQYQYQYKDKRRYVCMKMYEHVGVYALKSNLLACHK